ncbi:MAG: ABC transporter permease [Oryzihumus sp.]
MSAAVQPAMPATTEHELVTPRAGRQVLVVCGRALAERWHSLLGWGAAIALLSVLQLSVYPSVARSQKSMQDFLAQYPAGLRQAFGLEDYATPAGYVHAELFSLMVPIVLISVAVGAGSAATAGEEEHGTADLLFSLPVARGAVLAGKAAAMVLGVLAVDVVLLLSLLLGSPPVDLHLDTGHLLAATAQVSLLGVMFGALALAVGALTGRRGAATGAAIGLALLAFLVETLGPLADWLQPWQRWSPFHWALSNRPLAHGFDTGGALALAALTLVLLAAATLLLHRRDLRTT